MPPRALATVHRLVPLGRLVLPVDCAGCGAADEVLCPACALLVAAPPRRVCPPLWSGPAPAWAGPDYGGAVAAALVGWKDRGRHDLTSRLGGALASVIVAALAARRSGSDSSACAGPPDAVLAVPLPSGRRAVRQRGGDLVADLARVAARLARAESAAGRLRVAAVLVQRAGVLDQSRLGARRRQDNVAGRIAVHPAAGRLLAGRDVLLIDDVVTTGATAVEASRAIDRAGGRIVALATLSATPRHHLGVSE